MARLISVNVGLPREVTWNGKTVRTSVWKSPVTGRRMVRKLDIDGDARADLADHGGGASCHTDTFTRRPDGLTDVDAVVVRDGKNLKGRLLAAVLGTIGKGILEKAL